MKDLQHNIDVKVEEFLQQGGPPGVVNELLVGSPVERLIHIFQQPKPSPINQDTGNLFLRPELRVEQGGCNMAGVAKRMRDGDSSMHEDGMHRDLFAKNSSSSCVESDDDDWVLYAYHPKYGPFEVHQGVAVVADRFLVSGVRRIGFQSITLPADTRFMVR